MKPADKAQELVDKFWGLDPKYAQGGGDPDYELAKRMALIAVKEVLTEGAGQYGATAVEYGREDYWQEVILEIKKI